MKRELRVLLVTLLLTSVTACGGGGSSSGGSNNNGNNNGNNNPTLSSQMVSGSVVQTTAGASKAAIGADALIQLVSYDKKGTVLDQASASSTSSGFFTAPLKLSSDGGYVIITVQKEGFVEYTRRVDYTTPGALDLKAELQTANVVISKVTTAATFTTYTGASKASAESFNFAVLRFPNGTKKAVAGAAIKAAKAAGGATELDINIPASSLPGVSALKGELNSYDPATSSLPGSYKGVVGDKEGTMVSLAFDYIKITDADTGKKLSTVAKELVKAGVKKAAAATTTVTRWIPTDSCSNIFLQDYDKTAAGWQVPVWSLYPSTGKWVFLGVGTVVDSSGNPVTATDASGCSSNTYYLKILVSNTDFQNSYWNLDHIVFSTPKFVCLKGTITDNSGAAVKGLPLSLYGNGFEYGYGRTGDDGAYLISTVLINNNANRNGTLNYYNLGEYQDVAVTLGDDPNCGTKNITLTTPCEVSGKVVNSSGAAVANKMITLTGTSTSRGTLTDSNGAFSSTVKCSEDISVYLGYSYSSSAAIFKVNGSTSDYPAYEASDTGTKVTLSNITARNLAPTAYGYLSNRSIKTTGSASVYISAYDEEGDYPISYAVTSGTAINQTGTIEASSGSATATLSGLAVGTYPLSLKVTDSQGNSRTVDIGTLQVFENNRAPIAYAYANKNFVEMGGTEVARTVTLNGSAYDNDGDKLSYAWTVNDGTTTTTIASSSTPSAGSVTSSTTYIIPSTGTEGQVFTFTFTVTDDGSPAKSGTATLTVTYGGTGDVKVTVQ